MSAIRPISTLMRRVIAAAVSTCLALAAALALAAPADAGPRTFRPAVVQGSVPTAGELTAMRDIRAKSVRTVFRWEVVEAAPRTGSSCSTARYDFSRYDPLVRAAGERRVSILPVFGGSPEYVEPNASLRHDAARYPTPGTRAFGNFQCFVRAVVGRYGRGGTFGARDIVDWQLWNEPNLKLYSPNQDVSPAKYGKLVKATATTIRSLDGRATVVLAGLPETPAQGMNSNVFLRKMYRVKKIRSKFDAVALHPYARNARGTKGALIRLRETLRDLGDRRRPVWVTEIGWASDGNQNYFAVTTEKGQADRLQSTFQMFRKNRDRFKIGTFYWYNFHDEAGYAENTGNWTNYAGLYLENGTPKPACNRYKRFTGASGSCRNIQGPASDASLTSADGFLLGSDAAGGALEPAPPEE